MKSKQPVVYVARELKVPDEEGSYHVFGWFVSAAYLRRTVIDYTTSGDKYYNYLVDFSVEPAIFAIDDKVSIFVENGDRQPKSKIFKDYPTCKAYVNKLNEGRVEHLLSSKSAYRYKSNVEAKFNEVMDYAKRLEARCIPVLERQEQETNKQIEL